ncbi:hypothetical protein EDF56_10115 [Novosphingobium sp. PhB165]|uniref:hypothetical protein n=1 Tax=Novosphingobium sp. PhB165 TaxID=2485105 RepID=UPI001042E79A|nr:hypothetical protein [Novosphingobium sp. PhB165]TCM21351.1 hypothetical protein EDF56_10115 [Novosphingobium sp. PhB165]
MSQQSIQPLVHIGFHKTASTLLQRTLFARSDLGFERPGRDRVRLQADFIRYGAFDEMEPKVIEAYHRLAYEARTRGRTLVLSHERLSGYPGSGGFDARMIADRVKTCLPDARILVFVREQRSMLYSYYLQYITDGGSLSFRRLTRPIQPKLFRKPEFDLRSFAYVPLIEYYRTLFGSENVLVIPYEALRGESWRIAVEIARFCGQSTARIEADIFGDMANASMPLMMQLLRRHLNGLIYRNQLSPHAPIAFNPFDRWYRRMRPLFEPTRLIDAPLRRRLKRQIEDVTGDRYAESNLQLQRMTAHDLSRYGYRLSVPSSAPQPRTTAPNGNEVTVRTGTALQATG